MPFDPREPIDAILVVDEPPPPRRRRWWVWGGGCLFVTLAVACLAAWLVAGFLGDFGSSADDPVARWETTAERQAALRQAFDGRRHSLQDSDLPEIQRLLRRVAATASREDSDEFQKLVDTGRMVRRIQGHADVEWIDWIERQVLASQIRTGCDPPGNTQDFRIVHLERLGDDHVRVYAYAVNDGACGDPFQFWLVRARDGWRLYDWERVELGWSEAAQYARLRIAADDWRYDGYEQSSEELVAADEAIDQDEYDAAAEHMQAAAGHSVPNIVADFWAYLVAIRWSSLDNSEQCLAWCSRAQNPDAIPGFYTLQASHLQQTEQYEAALAAIENYERVAGFHPDVIRMKAGCLSDLRRDEESLACWRQLVEFAPDGIDDLRQFADALPADRRGELLDVLPAAPQPVAVAVQLAERRVGDEDGELLALLHQFVAARSPGSPEALQLEGRRLQFQGEYEQAAERFRQAAEQELDPEQRAGSWSSFLQAMVDAGQVVAGYEALPDPRDAFQSLAGGLENDEAMIDYTQLPELLAVHRRRCPDDGWLHYFAGLLADQNGDLEAAAREFAAAGKSDDEDLKAAAADQRRDLLCRQGKVLEAYRLDADAAGTDAAEAFRELADICRFNDDAPGLQTLLKTHRSDVPDEPWLGYYTAVLLQLQRQTEAAVRSLDGRNKSADEELEDALQALRLELLLDLGRWRQAYDERPDEVFSQVANHLRFRRNWAALAELCALHRQRNPEDAELLRLAVELAAGQRDDQRVVQLLTPWPADKIDGEYRASLLRRQLVRSLLRLGRSDEAHQFAVESVSAEGDQALLLSTLIWQQRWDELTRRLADKAAGDEFADLVRYPSREDLLQAYRTHAGATDLRRRFPLTLPEDTPVASRIVLLLRAPADLNADRLRGLAAGTGEFAVRPLPTLRPDVATVFEVRDAGGSAVVAAGTGSYCDPRWFQRTRIPDPALATILKQHGGWIAIQGMEANDEDDVAPVERLVRRLAAGLLDADVQAVNVWGMASGGAHLAATDETSADRVRGEAGLDLAFADALNLFLEPRDQEHAGTAAAAGPVPRRELVALVQALKTPSSEPPHWVRVELRLGEAGETHWLRVISAKHTRWGDIELVGEFAGDSQLWPYLKPGERAVVMSSSVLGVRRGE